MPQCRINGLRNLWDRRPRLSRLLPQAAKVWLVAGVLGCARIAAQQTGELPSDEALRFNVNWPSGLSLGEVQMNSRRLAAEKGPGQWEFEFVLDAALPGFAVQDRYRAIAGAQLCSLELEKQSSRGKRRSMETSTFNTETGVVTRVTLGGGRSEIPLPPCSKDGVTFLYYLRQQLRQGRVPPAQTVLLGASYQVRVQYGGTQSVRIGDASVEADKLVATVKGPASAVTFELFFAKDAARTPVLARVPLSMGTFSMELVRP